jgi:16S rRNA (guanine1516-N2)-methyltransferase
MPKHIVICAESDDLARQAEAQRLAESLGLPLVDPAKLSDDVFVLAVGGDALEVRDGESKPGTGLSVDFSALNPRQAGRRGGLSRKQPLARAVGAKSRTVLDATAGMGHDAALLACMGFTVTAIERSPIVAALLNDGFCRAMADPVLREWLDGRLEIIHADATEVIVARGNAFDAIYIDPMFPPKRKASALARKSVRLIREIVGDDSDASELVAAARAHCPRVVVKRPTHADPLMPKPTAVIASKLVRYDIYASGEARKPIASP